MGTRLRAFFLLLLAAFVVAASIADAQANSHSHTHGSRAKHSSQAKIIRPGRAAPVAPSRSALLMIDADTGKVIFSQNATARRYPASLTKLMTLYLAFEALQQGRMKMETALPVSAKAAGMPSTNLSLRAGQTITAKDAIEALIVQSANDAAVVIAENLGSTSWGFALKMTAKARELGMEDTVFRNPNGLPDTQQYTSAHDLALLAVALRRDFPQYYPMFHLKSCSYGGRTYYSHNRAMWRIPGADGLKTGFINLSGFNLVTSVTRNGKHVVGVVMGGSSGQSRDDQMVRMIEQTYANIGNPPNSSEIASGYLPIRKGPGATLYASAPVNLPAKKVTIPAAEAKALIAAATQSENAAEQPEVLNAPSNPTPPAVTRVITNSPAAQPPAKASDKRSENAPAGNKSGQTSGQYLRLPGNATAAGNGQFQPSAGAPVISGGTWGIQVGAYSGQQDALVAANQAATVAGSSVAGAQINVSGSTAAGQTIHRARLVNLSESNARQACRALISRNASCFVYRTDNSQL